MDILILQSCVQCKTKEWTPIVSPSFVCSKCQIQKCPECKNTEVMYLVTLKDEVRTTKIRKCLSEDCIYSEDYLIDADFYNKSEKGQITRRRTLKPRKFVCRKLNFDV